MGFTAPGNDGGLTAPKARGQEKPVRKWVLRGGVGVAVVAVVIAGVVVVQRLTDPCQGGTFGYQGTCVGVTDGSYDFSPSVKSVEESVKKQNDAAEKSGDYVSIALLTPLTSGPGSDVTPDRVRQQIEGAATAQAYLNGQGFRPRIRLLLANEDSQQQAWPQVVSQLRQEQGSQHIVAVVGVGLSTTQTISEARKLSAGPSPLPMIGTVDTGDGLNTAGPQSPLVPESLSGPLKGLVRVEPSISDEISMLARYYGTPRAAGSARLSPHAVLVYDNDSSDLYTGSLDQDFTKRFGAEITDRKQFAPGPDEANEFADIAGAVCAPAATSTPVILYAGRQSAFPDFIRKLRSQTNCPSRDTVTVLTGADAESVDPSVTGPNPDGPAIRIVYPNIADPGRLEPWYKQAFEGAPADVTASWAIMTFDGVAAAEQAARRAGQGAAAPPTVGSVASLLYDFNQLNDPVKGATGPFVITASGDEGCQWLPLIVEENGKASVQSEARVGCPSSS